MARKVQSEAEKAQTPLQEAKWVTYFRIDHDQFTQRADEPAPRHHWESRPATKQEIAEEQDKRRRAASEKVILGAFESRQDYQDAKAIAGILEWITPDKHCLDNLMP